MRLFNAIRRDPRNAAATKSFSMFRVVACLSFVVSFVQAQAQIAGNDDVSLRHLQRAVVAIGEGDLTQAETILSSMLAGKPQDADALNLLGVVRARQNRATEAERLFQRSLRVSPTHLGAHINLGELYINTKRTKLATQILLTGHKLAPDRAEINLKLAELYGDAGFHERALEHLRLIPRSDASPEYFAILLRSLLKLNRLEEARKLAREFKDIQGGEVEERVRFAMLLAA